MFWAQRDRWVCQEWYCDSKPRASASYGISFSCSDPWSWVNLVETLFGGVCAAERAHSCSRLSPGRASCNLVWKYSHTPKGKTLSLSLLHLVLSWGGLFQIFISLTLMLLIATCLDWPLVHFSSFDRSYSFLGSWCWTSCVFWKWMSILHRQSFRLRSASFSSLVSRIQDYPGLVARTWNEFRPHSSELPRAAF